MHSLIGLGDDQPDSEKPNNETDGEWDPSKVIMWSVILWGDCLKKCGGAVCA